MTLIGSEEKTQTSEELIIERELESESIEKLYPEIMKRLLIEAYRFVATLQQVKSQQDAQKMIEVCRSAARQAVEILSIGDVDEESLKRCKENYPKFEKELKTLISKFDVHFEENYEEVIGAEVDRLSENFSDDVKRFACSDALHYFMGAFFGLPIIYESNQKVNLKISNNKVLIENIEQKGNLSDEDRQEIQRLHDSNIPYYEKLDRNNNNIKEGQVLLYKDLRNVLEFLENGYPVKEFQAEKVISKVVGTINSKVAELFKKQSEKFKVTVEPFNTNIENIVITAEELVSFWADNVGGNSRSSWLARKLNAQNALDDHLAIEPGERKEDWEVVAEQLHEYNEQVQNLPLEINIKTEVITENGQSYLIINVSDNGKGIDGEIYHFGQSKTGYDKEGKIPTNGLGMYSALLSLRKNGATTHIIAREDGEPGCTIQAIFPLVQPGTLQTS